jgi:hypothetical protein
MAFHPRLGNGLKFYSLFEFNSWDEPIDASLRRDCQVFLTHLRQERPILTISFRAIPFRPSTSSAVRSSRCRSLQPY